MPSTNYSHFLSQKVHYYPDSQEKIKEVWDNDYYRWHTVIYHAVDSGELRKDTDV